jgi:hypothetical protein
MSLNKVQRGCKEWRSADEPNNWKALLHVKWLSFNAGCRKKTYQENLFYITEDSDIKQKKDSLMPFKEDIN